MISLAMTILEISSYWKLLIVVFYSRAFKICSISINTLFPTSNLTFRNA